MKKTIYADPIIAERIQQVFWDNDLNDCFVGKACRVNRKAIGTYRRGERPASIKFIRYLCATYHVQADWILNLK